jgi:hypothetical protein
VKATAGVRELGGILQGIRSIVRHPIHRIRIDESGCTCDAPWYWASCSCGWVPEEPSDTEEMAREIHRSHVGDANGQR